MSEIGTLSLERLNNGAHFLFISNVLARAEADANVKSKLSAQIVSLKAAMEQEDETLANVNPDEFDIVVLPGGYGGMMNFKNSEAVAGLLKKFVSENKWIAAICASPSVFGVLGLAEGKKCTCYPGFEEEMKGADCTGENVVVDGKMITSKGPGTSIDFALKMIEILVSKEKADEVAEAAQYSK